MLVAASSKVKQPEKYKFSLSISLTLKSVDPSLCPPTWWILEVLVELKYVAVHQQSKFGKSIESKHERDSFRRLY